MKKSILYLIFLLLNYYPGYCQEIINNTGSETNEAIQQIRTPGIDNILIFQNMNRGISNYVSAQQIGNQNRTSINQQNNASSEMSNQSYTVQSGNSNELTIGQIGRGNLLLGFQLGYLASLTNNQQSSSTGTVSNNVLVAELPNIANGYIAEGERNIMDISQNGNNNGVMAVQLGSGNAISAEQMGNNNYLLAYQKGTNNSVTGYKQENVSEQILYDKIIQIGDNLSLKVDEASKSSTGNTFMQTGANLSIMVNNELLNSAGGMQINQKGNDMKIVIDQSYFSFPMR
jgi:hypothetical protein